MSKLTKAQVLVAVGKAVAPYSAYIGDEVHKAHAERVRAGGKGHAPRTSLILTRLNSLAADGLLRKSKFPNGYYGYTWTITDLGRAALSKDS